VLAATAALVAGGAAATVATGATASPKPDTTTPIKHLVVIFQENVSFDHYFGTYPNATGQGGSPFHAKPGTPAVTGLTTALLTSNPNGSNPARLSPSNVNDVLTCDQDHNYTDEQTAFDNGAMDKFLTSLGNGTSKSPEGAACTKSTVMNYYDGNTVTSLWNYAQHFAMSDNSYGTTFGPSSPGAINLISGDTGAVDMTHTANSPSQTGANADLTADGKGGFSLTSDAQPYYDDCSTRDAVAMSGQNIGDLLNAQGVSWGWFQGGFRPSLPYATALTELNPPVTQPTSTFVPDQFKALGATDPNVVAKTATNQAICNTANPIGVELPASLGTGTGQYGVKDDYIPHHEPFQYYASTANPHHLTLPTNASGQDTLAGLKTIGTDTQSYVGGVPQFNTPNHQYDSSDFDQLVAAIGKGELSPSALPAVSFLKAPGWADGHAAYSDPLDEQYWVTNEINALEKTPDWKNTAVVISYDDSDGWYDHVYSGVTNPSSSVGDTLTGAGVCGTGTPLAGENGRCGLGPRLPLLVISPWAKTNFVDTTKTNQASITKFVEDNWELGRISGSFDSISGSLNHMFDFDKHGVGDDGRGKLFLSPVTGEPVW
jgi:phospholipase C